MAKIEFPKQLKLLFEEEDSDLHAPIRALADRVGEILADNKLPFFPDYTDHGTDHINSVLRSQVELVPKDVWEKSKRDSDPRLLCDADAAVIIGATLLHDIAMHLRPDGFRELVGKGSRFQPLPWFKDRQEGHSADRPWHELWGDYEREARRFNDQTLGNIIGLESSRHWKFQDLPTDAGRWERNHFLIVGEFIRRHHARLAHEIAMYGFPGIPIGNGVNRFPAMGREEGHPLRRLADLIGLTARSHGTSLRVCQAYIQSSPSYLGTPRPMGTAVLYPMALLRVADYLQIDGQRAPAVLLQLRNPQSPISVQEWNKHLAVQQISPATDPRGKMVTVSTSLTLELYLQLRELIAGLQSEMDHSTAVLDEAYGARSDLGLNHLGLAIRRVYSNLHSPAFRDSLPYVPERTGFAADPNLLALLVEPLYGKNPGVGVRELMQNAVDAVCELDAWCKTHGKALDSLDLPEQETDVLIDFIKRDDGTWFLRVQDKGIGMRSDTIQNYFLRAGASFRRSADWAKEFIDGEGKPQVLRSGRFGVGAFAIFLLGPTFRLWTRHVTAGKSMGYTLEASSDSHLIEIQRANDLPVGTRIEVELTSKSIAELELEEKHYATFLRPGHETDWFCWDWPRVTRRLIRELVPEIFEQQYAAPLRKGKLGVEWSLLRPEGYEAVYWTFGAAPNLVCNGLMIGEPKMFSMRIFGFTWPEEAQLGRPKVAILDGAANLPVTIQRFDLVEGRLPFIQELTRDVTLSFIAYALVCGSNVRKKPYPSKSRHPLNLEQYSIYREDEDEGKFLLSKGLLRWCMTPNEMVPADPWLYSLLQVESCFVWGIFDLDLDSDFDEDVLREIPNSFTTRKSKLHFSTLNWHAKFRFEEGNRVGRLNATSHLPRQILTELIQCGIAALGHELDSSQIVVSAGSDFDFWPNWPITNTHISENEGEDVTIWHHSTDCLGAKRSHYIAQKGTIIPAIPLEPILHSLEKDITSYDKRPPDVIFVAELKTKVVSRSPESLIARVWSECLGPRAIPFDLVARQALIEHGKNHSELKRHIEAWEEMKQTGSEWV